jgi:4-amino-4-deoxy-L-arabinose transferase-like glycosyltransferase
MKVVSNVKADGFLKKINPGMLFIFFFLVIGTILRVWQYAANRSLWLDECALALNFIHRSFAGLTQQPLEYNQAAPLLFLFIQKIIVLVLGYSEFALRLFPLMAGILTLFLMYKTAKKYLQGIAVYVALALCCFSSALIYYSSENKQYGSDVMVTLILLLAGYPCLHDDAKPRNYMLLAGAGLIIMWLSHPAVFVLAGIGIVAMILPVFKIDWKKISWSALMCLIWLINLGFLYLIFLRYTVANKGSEAFWKDFFMPMPPWNNWGWFRYILESSFNNPFGLSFITVSAVLLLIGLISILRRKWTIGLVLILIIISTFIATGFRKYSFVGRLILFLVPIIFILIAEGIERIRSIMVNYSQLVASFTAVALTLLLLAQPVIIAIDKLQNPTIREHIRPIVEYVSRNRYNSDVIYVHHGSRPALKYYAPFYGFNESDYRVGVRAIDEPIQYWKDIDTLKGKDRVWFIFGHHLSKDKIDERLYYLIHLNKIGKKIDEFTAPGAAVYLYDLKGSSTRLR